MKKQIGLFLLVVLCFLGVSGCSSKTNSTKGSDRGTSSYAQTLGALARSTEEGCFLFIGVRGDCNYLNYYDTATKQTVPLCGKADCTHDTIDCNSFFSTANINTLMLEEDKLYFVAGDDQYYDDGRVIYGDATLYRFDLDGSNREKVFSVDENQIGDIMECEIAGDKLYGILYRYIAEEDDKSSPEHIFAIYELDLTGKKEPRLLFDGARGEEWDVSDVSNLSLYNGKLYYSCTRYNADRGEYLIEEYDLEKDTCKTVYMDQSDEIKFTNYVIKDQYLYYSDQYKYKPGESGSVIRINMETGEEETFLPVGGTLSYDEDWFYVICENEEYATEEVRIYTLEGEYVKSLPLPIAEELIGQRGFSVSMTKDFVIARQTESDGELTTYHTWLYDKKQLKEGGDEWGYCEAIRDWR